MYSVAKLSARWAGDWSRLQILFRLAASLSPADASLFHALTSLSPADASLFHALTSLSPADASLFSSDASLFPITGDSIPIAEPKFIIPPSVRFPSRSGGEPRRAPTRFPLPAGGNLKELIRVHRLSSLCARRARFFALTPSPSPTGWERGVGAHGGAPCSAFPLSRRRERGTKGVRAIQRTCWFTLALGKIAPASKTSCRTVVPLPDLKEGVVFTLNFCELWLRSWR
jgi:hypothetical protein